MQVKTGITKIIDKIRLKISFYSQHDMLSERLLTKENLEPKELFELKNRFDKLELLYDEFEGVQLEVELACSEEQLEKQYEERCNFSNSYNKILAEANEILSRFDTSDEKASVHSVQTTVQGIGQASLHNNMVDNMNSVKLPPIKCPTFNCEFNRWLEFKDTFEALFHNNMSLTDIQKFHYLRSCLGEEAIKIIQSLEFAANNYSNAWALLCERFDNSRLLVNNHLKALFELNSISKESSLALRSLIDSVNKHLRALKTLKLPTDEWDAIIIYMVALKLGRNTNREWEQSKKDKQLPTLAGFFEFLKNRADFLETIELNNSQKAKEHCDRTIRRHSSFLINNSSDSHTESKCNYCKQQHLIYTCDKFLKLPVSERWTKVNEMKLCSNCLCLGHFNHNCRSGPCKYCRKKHSSLLHYRKEATSTQPKPNSTDCHNEHGEESSESHENQFNGSSVVCANNSAGSYDSYIILSTAIVEVRDKYGQYHSAYAILDSGSQCSFITEQFSKILNVDVNHTNISANLSCLIVPKITDNLPGHTIDISGWEFPPDIRLANPSFQVSKKVDLLIGADLFWNVLCEGKINLGKNKPMLINTVFGYVVSGAINIPNNTTVRCNFVVNDDLQRFWAIEEIPTETLALTKEEKLCEDYFDETVTRDISGKFIVRFPLKCSASTLGNSYNIAIKRLLSQENKLKKTMKCIKKLANDNKDIYPVACKIIDHDMYVDDLITEFNEIDQAITICNQIAKVLKSAAFSLRKWASNSETILAGLEETYDAFSILDLSKTDKIKTLGLQWSAQSDSLSYKDPVDIEFHGFSDASLQAYSAVVYVRTTDCVGKTWVQLLCAKTKVAPVKALTIPRLELCGALILARLMKQVSDSFTCNFKIYYWCDSQIVLHWLNTDANKLQTFVSNRVAQIQKLCEISQWSYINSKDNPADVASRGMYPKELSTCRIWWEGPTVLYGDVIWPCHFKPHQTDLPEIRKTVNILTAIPTLSIFDRYSDLKKLRRVFGYCLRFIYNMLNKTKRLSGPLTVLELENSMLHLTKIAQQDTFRAEISSIKNDNSLSKKHRLSALNPFIDSDGLLRVGGRLKNSSLSFNQKHPILLDDKDQCHESLPAICKDSKEYIPKVTDILAQLLQLDESDHNTPTNTLTQIYRKIRFVQLRQF
nr:unnamed protein product [Callosobruchus analis]